MSDPSEIDPYKIIDAELAGPKESAKKSAGINFGKEYTILHRFNLMTLIMFMTLSSFMSAVMRWFEWPPLAFILIFAWFITCGVTVAFFPKKPRAAACVFGVVVGIASIIIASAVSNDVFPACFIVLLPLWALAGYCTATFFASVFMFADLLEQVLLKFRKVQK